MGENESRLYECWEWAILFCTLRGSWLKWKMNPDYVSVENIKDVVLELHYVEDD